MRNISAVLSCQLLNYTKYLLFFKVNLITIKSVFTISSFCFPIMSSIGPCSLFLPNSTFWLFSHSVDLPTASCDDHSSSAPATPSKRPVRGENDMQEKRTRKAVRKDLFQVGKCCEIHFLKDDYAYHIYST